jgi:hypothetical protein
VQRILKIWVLVAYITGEFILGVDILQAYDTSVDMGCHMLLLGQEEVPVREVPTVLVLKLLQPTESRRNGRLVC